MDPAQIFGEMDKQNNGVLCLDDLQGCIECVPEEHMAEVKAILKNYIFTYKNFDIDKQTFIKLCKKEEDTLPMCVHIDLQVLLGAEPVKKQPKLFSLRLLKRLKEKQSSNVSLRKILDESEEFCEK